MQQGKKNKAVKESRNATSGTCPRTFHTLDLSSVQRSRLGSIQVGTVRGSTVRLQPGAAAAAVSGTQRELRRSAGLQAVDPPVAAAADQHCHPILHSTPPCDSKKIH